MPSSFNNTHPQRRLIIYNTDSYTVRKQVEGTGAKLCTNVNSFSWRKILSFSKEKHFTQSHVRKMRTITLCYMASSLPSALESNTREGFSFCGSS